MSTSLNPPSSSGKAVFKVLGVILLLAAIAGFVYTGLKIFVIVKSAQAAHRAVWANLSVDQMTALLGEITGGCLLLFVGLRLLQVGSKKKPTAEAALSQSNELAIASTPVKPVRHKAAKRWQSCNILKIGTDAHRLWTFNASKGGFNLSQDQTIPGLMPLPASLVVRDWKTLLQPKLNIAWLPLDQVFLRVTHLPVSDFDETMAMVELQLEKISPLPVTQIVWTIQVMPQQHDNLQTIIVIMMARDLAEKFLGDLEAKGFLPHRLELPLLDQLLATQIRENGAYIYPDNTPGKYSALVAWWYDGVLRNLGLLHVPAVEGRDAVLKEQLAQMAWSGELEGWLHSEPLWHLVADEATAANWQPMFRPWLGHDVAVSAPVAEPQLATLNANRAARADLGVGILPEEYATRYQQEFVDRLWMRLVGAVLAVYVAGVIIYMGGTSWKGMSADNVEGTAANLSRTYTNTMQLKAQMQILQNRQALKFASLDCWKTTAELLPEGLTVQSMEFHDGKHLNLSGVGPGDQGSLVTDFNEALRKARLNDQPMFDNVDPPTVKLNPGGATLSWNFGADLANAEEEK